MRAEAEARSIPMPAGHLLSGLVARWSKRQLAGAAPGAELLAEGCPDPSGLLQRGRGPQRTGCCRGQGVGLTPLCWCHMWHEGKAGSAEPGCPRPWSQLAEQLCPAQPSSSAWLAPPAGAAWSGLRCGLRDTLPPAWPSSPCPGKRDCGA